jgi:hypothetical protein
VKLIFAIFAIWFFWVFYFKALLWALQAQPIPNEMLCKLALFLK